MAVRRSGDPRRLDPLSGRFTDYIVIDTETTGLSVRKGAKLIEIGAVKIHNDELVDEFDRMPREGDTVYGFAVGIYPTDHPALPEAGD